MDASAPGDAIPLVLNAISLAEAFVSSAVPIANGLTRLRHCPGENLLKKTLVS